MFKCIWHCSRLIRTFPFSEGEDLKPGRPDLYSQTNSRPDGVARECLRNRVASVCAPRARLRKGKVIGCWWKKWGKVWWIGIICIFLQAKTIERNHGWELHIIGQGYILGKWRKNEKIFQEIGHEVEIWKYYWFTGGRPRGLSHHSACIESRRSELGIRCLKKEYLSDRWQDVWHESLSKGVIKKELPIATLSRPGTPQS